MRVKIYKSTEGIDALNKAPEGILDKAAAAVADELEYNWEFLEEESDSYPLDRKLARKIAQRVIDVLEKAK